MKKYIANVKIMPLKNLADPQGKAVMNALHRLTFKSVSNVRIGKNILIEFTALDYNSAKQLLEQMCEKLLRNPVVEYFEYELIEEK